MPTDYPLRVGLVVEAARLVREKKQSDVAREATALGYEMVQSTVSAVEVSGRSQTSGNLWAIATVLGIDLWVVFRIASMLPESCTESPSGRAKALGKAVELLEAHIRDAQQ